MGDFDPATGGGFSSGHRGHSFFFRKRLTPFSLTILPGYNMVYVDKGIHYFFIRFQDRLHITIKSVKR